MKGDKVIVRAFGGVALVRRVWAVKNGLVYISDEKEFHKREAGEDALEPIGFPVADVFAYDETFAASGGDWRKLRRYHLSVATGNGSY
jgi:phage repressor protein C with HTH and peptisase S24 domain